MALVQIFHQHTRREILNARAQHAHPARAREDVVVVPFSKRAGGQAPPPVEGAWPSARARARARAKYRVTKP